MAADLIGAEGDATPHAERFRLVLAGLAGIAVAALAVAVILALGAHGDGGAARSPGAGDSAQWSSWRPDATGNEGAEEIADYLAPFYRLSATSQLAVITPVGTTQFDATSGSFTGSGLTVALDASAGGGSSDLEPLVGHTVAYDLCGQGGPGCAVGGHASTARLLLLRREALELALYTLEYLPGTENVVAVLPPAHTAGGRKVIVSVLLTRQQLSPLLTEPLSATLTALPPSVGQLKLWSRSQEAGLVDELTSRNLFAERLETEQDGTKLLELTPLPAQ